MLKLLFADIKMLFRNKQAFFWSLAFPLIFITIFGLFFGGNQTSGGKIALINNSNTQVASSFQTALTQSGIFKVDESITDIETGRNLVKKGKISAIVIVPENFGAPTLDSPKNITIVNDPGNQQANALLISFADKFFTNLTFAQNKIPGPAFSVQEEKVNNKDLNYFDFVLAGILGLALMNSSIIGISVGMAKYREDKILKRITTTPIKMWWFIASEVISRLMINLIQITFILLLAIYAFHAHIYGNLFVIFLLALMGGVLFQLIGFAIASFTKTTDAAQGMATAVTIPMMFLAGIFFPIDSLPGWLSSIVQYLPLAPLLRMLRDVTLDGISPFDNPMNMIIVGAWILIALAISIWKFRLVED